MLVLSFASVVDHTPPWVPIQQCLREEECELTAEQEQQVLHLIAEQEGALLQDELPVLLAHYGWSEISIMSLIRSALRDGVPEKMGWTLRKFLGAVLRDHIHPGPAGKLLLADAILAHLRAAQEALKIGGGDGGGGEGEEEGGGGGAGAVVAHGAAARRAEALNELAPPRHALNDGVDKIAPRRCFDTRHLPVRDEQGFAFVTHEMARRATGWRVALSSPCVALARQTAARAGLLWPGGRFPPVTDQPPIVLSAPASDTGEQ